MPVDKDDAVEAATDQAAPDIIKQVEQGAAAQGDGAVPHSGSMHVLR